LVWFIFVFSFYPLILLWQIMFLFLQLFMIAIAFLILLFPGLFWFGKITFNI